MYACMHIRVYVLYLYIHLCTCKHNKCMHAYRHVFMDAYVYIYIDMYWHTFCVCMVISTCILVMHMYVSI